MNIPITHQQSLRLIAIASAALLFIITCTSQAATRYVRSDSASPFSPYTGGWGSAAVTIQAALDVSSAGDEIIVSNGTYTAGGRVVGPGALTNRVVITNAVTVRGLNGPDVTIIAGAPSGSSTGPNAVRGVYMIGGATLEGFTITNGSTLSSGDDCLDLSGGGVWCASDAAVISNCVITGNRALRNGAGILRGTVRNSSISRNFIASGSAAWGSGACSSVLHGCTVVLNDLACNATGGSGAADCTAYNSVISSNRLAGRYSRGAGANGGTFYNCRLEGNVNIGTGSTYGGGASGSTLYSCLLLGNRALDGGGAWGGTLVNCTVLDNVALNNAGGILGSTVKNTIVYYNTAYTNENYSGGSFSNSCVNQSVNIELQRHKRVHKLPVVTAPLW